MQHWGTVTNHLNFCMMATTITRIDADRFKADPERRYFVKGRASFAFSDVQRLIANAALINDLLSLWPALRKSRQNTFVAVLWKTVRE